MGETANIGSIAIITVAALLVGGAVASPFVGSYMQSKNKKGGTKHRRVNNNTTRRK